MKAVFLLGLLCAAIVVSAAGPGIMSKLAGLVDRGPKQRHCDPDAPCDDCEADAAVWGYWS